MCRCRALTLIEVMVTIATIALLIGLLLPALTAARRTAVRVQCLSHLRSVHQMFHVYATAHGDQVPIGFRGGQKQFNTMIYSGWQQRFSLFGLLYLEGLMDEPRVYYCPAETAADQAFDTPANPWPPGPALLSSVGVQGGYAARPMVAFDQVTADGTAEYPERFPQLTELGSQAILADGTGLPERVQSRHVRGVNALHADGAARWVERGAIAEPLERITGIDAAFNGEQDAIWSIFDEQR